MPPPILIVPPPVGPDASIVPLPPTVTRPPVTVTEPPLVAARAAIEPVTVVSPAPPSRTTRPPIWRTEVAEINPLLLTAMAYGLPAARSCALAAAMTPLLLTEPGPDAGGPAMTMSLDPSGT